MSGILKLAISSRISDKDDFRRLVLRSDDRAAEISFSRNSEGEMMCTRGDVEDHVPEDEVFNAVDQIPV